MILVSTDEIGRLCVRPLEPEESAELCKKHGLVIGVASMRKWRTGGRIRNPSVIDSLLEDEESMDQVG